jgi:hypothetical protein
MRRRFFHPVVPLLTGLVLACAHASAADDDGGAWPPGPDSAFRADVHPSVRGAVRALGHDVATAVGAFSVRTPHPGPLETITVFLPAPGGDAWRDALDAIRNEHPGAELVRRTAELPESGRPAAGEVWVEFVRLDVRPSRVGWSRGPAAEGRVRARVVGAASSATVAARYEEKPWAEDPSGFTGGDPRRVWEVGRANRPSADRSESERSALADAARRLAARVGGARPLARGVGEDDVRRCALAALSRGQFIADRFTRRFDRPYGRVWDSAVLVDASPAALESLACEAGAARRARREAILAASAGAGALVVLVLLLYGVFNALTKGYFVWRLRAAAAILLFAGLATLGALV